MLLATSRISARRVTFYNSFDKYNGREGPEGDIVFSNVLQSPTGSAGNFRDFGQWTTELSSVVYVKFRGDRRF